MRLVVAMSAPLPFFGSPQRGAASSSVPPLTELALTSIADNCEGIVDLCGMPENLIVALLGKIIQRGRLDYRLACIFRDSGHEELRAAISELDLLASIPTHNALGSRGSLGGGGCR